MNGRVLTFMVQLGLYLMVLVVPGTIHAQDNLFTVGIRGGVSSPYNWTLQGWHSVSYNTDGVPTDVNISGFGDGGEVVLYGGYTSASGSGWLLEMGARFLQRQTDLSLAPDGDREAYDNYLNTFYPVAISRVQRFVLAGTEVVPYLSTGVGFYISNWNAQHDYQVGETLSRTRDACRFTGLGLHFAVGFQQALYYDIMLEVQLKCTWIPSEVRIVDDETGTWITHEGLNIGGLSLQLGLGYRF